MYVTIECIFIITEIKEIFEFADESNKKKELKQAAQAPRTSRGQLFQDHLIIFNLMEGVNGQLEVMLESFYLSSVSGQKITI